MTTRATLKAEIIDDMERDATEDGARVLSAISAAIKFYQPKRFFFNESRSVTFNTVAAQDSYTFAASGGDITTEFYKIDGAYITESGNILELRRRNYRELETLITSSASQGRPFSFAYINRKLRLYVVPDAAYSVRLTGHIKIAEPSGDSTADNEWFTEAYELIRCRAKAYLYAHVFPDPGMAALMNEGERQALVSLRSATTDKIESGTLVPTQF